MSSTNPQTTDQRLPDWYDPFPEPNTMPRKWDLSQYGYTQGDTPKPKQAPAEKRDRPDA